MMGLMGSTELARLAKKPQKRAPDDRRGLTTKEERAYKKQIAQLYGRGISRRRLSLTYYDKIHPESRGRDHDDRIKLCERRLREWEREQPFRDMVWDEAVSRLDMDSPDILAGVSKKAKDGRVDAAKLALAVTGRHQPIEQVGSATNVQVVFASNIPRPTITAPPPVALSQEVAAIARQARSIRQSGAVDDLPD